MRLVIFSSFLPHFSCTLFVYRDLHVVQEGNIASKAQIEEVSMHLFKISGFVDVPTRVVVKDFNKSKFYLLGIISGLVFIQRCWLGIFFAVCYCKLIRWHEKIDATAFGYWK
jgi:hypothetical protein